MIGYGEPTVILNSRDVFPTLCDIPTCQKHARYFHQVSKSYFCTNHMIDCLESGAIKKGAILYRVPVYEL